MADIRIGVTGDASGGVAAMEDMADALGKSVAKWTDVSNAAKMAAKAVVDFAVQSVQKFAEAERMQAQLTRAAGEYSEALSDQASALSELYAVDDDIIKQSEILLTQWGGVGAATKDVEQAILDYAAATGQDAVSATQDLIRNVESGGTGLAKMGVHFKATGDKGKDLAAAVAALSGKFGGAAAADAATLTGSARGASLAFDELQESIGGVLSSMVKGSGITDFFTDIMRQAKDGVDLMKAVMSEDPQDVGAQINAGMDFVRKKWGTQKQDELPNTVTGKTNKQMKEDVSAAKEHATAAAEIQEQNAKDWKKHLKDLDTLDETARVKDQEDYADELKMSADRTKALIDEEQKRLDWRRDALLQIEKDNAAHAEKMAKDERRIQEQSDKQAMERVKERRRQAREIGDQIGAAFVNALSSQLEKLAEGGEFDVAVFIADILAATFAIAATAIGAAYGMPALGSAIGNLGAMGISAGGRAISAEERKAKRAAEMAAAGSLYHDGGWVGAPRHHSGSWIGSDEERAILQTGERVLSRREVGTMGGAGMVDKMAKGGSSRIVINVSALDAKSAAESLEGQVGKGLRRAIQSGRGDLPALFGMGPR